MFDGHLVRPQKPDRNDPCWCGSGKKYKKCHLDIDLDGLRRAREALPVAMAQFAENAERQARVERTLREQYGIYVNYVTPVQFNGRKVWAIGSRLYPNNPPDQTFTEFVISVLATELGEEWLTDQNALPPDEQHFVRRAYTEHIMWRHREMERREQEADGLWSAEPDGWTQYLVSLAFDIA
jgi:SEC-C motif